MDSQVLGGMMWFSWRFLMVMMEGFWLTYIDEFDGGGDQQKKMMVYGGRGSDGGDGGDGGEGLVV